MGEQRDSCDSNYFCVLEKYEAIIDNHPATGTRDTFSANGKPYGYYTRMGALRHIALRKRQLGAERYQGRGYTIRRQGTVIRSGENKQPSDDRITFEIHEVATEGLDKPADLEKRLLEPGTPVVGMAIPPPWEIGIE